MTRSHTELRSADSSLHHIDLGINPALFPMSPLTCLLKRSSTYSLMIVIATIIPAAVSACIGVYTHVRGLSYSMITELYTFKKMGRKSCMYSPKIVGYENHS
jgi:hypothetical protein